jgi:myosin heavy subunit
MVFFPIRIEALTRLEPKAEQEKIVKELKKGGIDIVIGTHRLLSADVEFSDLGLLIVDEEQRFGVKHKEKIKQMKESIKEQEAELEQNKEIRTKLTQARDYRKQASDLHAKVTEMADLAQKHHDAMVECYKKADKSREAADEVHRQFVEAQEAADAEHKFDEALVPYDVQPWPRERARDPNPTLLIDDEEDVQYSFRRIFDSPEVQLSTATSTP